VRNKMAALRVAESKTPHPFERCFTTLADYSPERAIGALSDAVRAEKQGMNAYDWIQEALPEAELKRAFAFGTVGELYRSYSRGQEYSRFKGTLRAA
jgi:hypothetical protein